MNRSRIALVIEGTYPWYRGGVSEWVARYIEAFSDICFHIVQIAPDPHLHTDLSDALYPVPTQVRQFERIQPPADHENWHEIASEWFQNQCKLVENTFINADVIHVANTGFAGWLGMRFAEKLQKPLILTEHALYWKEVEMGVTALECGYKVPNTSFARQRMANQFKRIAQQIYASADATISVSKCNIPEQQAMGASDVKYIPNGVNESWLQTHKKRNQPPVIGWIGRCAEMKNPLRFFEVVEAFRRQEKCDARFLMMICDANEPELQQTVVRRAMKFPELQLVCNEAAESHIGKMDALCVTSHNESQPLVLFEAMAQRVLPSGWEAGDVEGEYGIILSKRHSADDLVKEIIALWQQPEQWEREIEKNFVKVRNGHTWQHIFNRYRDLLEGCIKERIHDEC